MIRKDLELTVTEIEFQLMTIEFDYTMLDNPSDRIVMKVVNKDGHVKRSEFVSLTSEFHNHKTCNSM